MALKEKKNKYSEGVQRSKPFWKKWWFWVIIVLVLISGINTVSDDSVGETESQRQVTGESTEKQTEEVTQEPKTPTVEEMQESEPQEPETSAETKGERHIYDNAIVKPVLNGMRTEKIGEYSIIEVDSSLITDENLTDWYFNYVKNNDFNWSMIIYSDKNGGEGVYAIEGLIEKDVVFDKDEYGDYSLGDVSQCIIYAPDDEGALKVME